MEVARRKSNIIPISTHMSLSYHASKANIEQRKAKCAPKKGLHDLGLVKVRHKLGNENQVSTCGCTTAVDYRGSSKRWEIVEMRCLNRMTDLKQVQLLTRVTSGQQLSKGEILTGKKLVPRRLPKRQNGMRLSREQLSHV